MEEGGADHQHGFDARNERDRGILRAVLAINLAQCALGVAVGLWAGSTALIGAALDNLSDASVYALSLYAVGRRARVKIRTAQISGWLMVALAVLLLVEVGRRFFGGEPPIGPAMMAMAALNAAFNVVCLRLLARHRGEDVNFRASAIFTNNDSYVNMGIVVSGGLVMWLGSNIPDLVVGIIVAGIASHGGKEILEEARKADAATTRKQMSGV